MIGRKDLLVAIALGTAGSKFGETDEEQGRISWLWAGGAAFLHLILSRLSADLHHCTASWKKTQKMHFLLLCTFLLIWHFWTVEYLHHNEHQSKSVYCSIEAHCCGWGVRPGRLVTNRSSRRRFGLFSTQQSSRAHLAPPPPKTFHTTR